MRIPALIALLLTVFLAAGCARGPSDVEVEQAFRETLQRNDVMGFVANTMRIDKFQVDKLERKENGVWEAQVTAVLSAQLGPLSMGGARQMTLRLKKVQDTWVVLQ